MFRCETVHKALASVWLSLCSLCISLFMAVFMASILSCILVPNQNDVVFIVLCRQMLN